MKRREIVVSRTSRGARSSPGRRRRRSGRGRRRRGRRRGAARRVPGVVRVTDDERAVDDAVGRSTTLDAPADEHAGGAPADRADRGRPRGAAVRRRAAADPARDRRARRHGPGDGRRAPRRPRGRRCAARGHPPRASTATGSSSRPRPRPARWSRATSARTRSASRRRRSRRSRSSRTASPSRRPPSSASAASTPTTRSARCSTGGCRRAGPVGRAGPAVPVRHRLRVPRAVRADEPRGAAAARRRRRGPAGRGGRRTVAEPARGRRPHGSTTRSPRPTTGLMPAERLQKVLAAAGVASRRGERGAHRRGPRDRRRQGRDASATQVDPERSIIAVDGRVDRRRAAAWPTCCSTSRPASTSTVRDRHARTDRAGPRCRPRSCPRARGSTRSAGSTRTPRGCSCSPTTATGPSGSCIRATGSSASTRSGLRTALDGDQVGGPAAPGSRSRRASPTVAGLRADEQHRGRRACVELHAPGAARPLAWYRATLAQGWKRQLRRMFGAVGAPVERLVRVRIGPVRIDGLRSGRSGR